MLFCDFVLLGLVVGWCCVFDLLVSVVFGVLIVFGLLDCLLSFVGLVLLYLWVDGLRLTSVCWALLL